MTWFTPRVSAPFKPHRVHDIDHTSISTLYIPQRPWHGSHVYQHPLHPTASMTLFTPRVSAPLLPTASMTWITCVSAPFTPHSDHDMDHTTCISTSYTPQRPWHGPHHVYQRPFQPTESMTWIPRVSAPFTPHRVYDIDHTCISTLYTPQRLWHGPHHVYQRLLHPTASMTWTTPRVSAPFTSHSVHDMDHMCISTLYTPQRQWHGSHHVYQHPLHPTATMTWITPHVSAPFTLNSIHDMDHMCISNLYTPQRPWHGSHHVYQHPLHPTASMTWITRVSAPFTSHSDHDMDHTCISTLYIPQRPWHGLHNVY